MDQLIVSNRSRILELARKHHVSRIRLFGSMSRDSADSGSDVDLIADLEEDGTLFDLGAFLLDLQDLLGRPVQILTENALHPGIRSRALQEAVNL
ncbi:nucleotidyltransferase family protein [Candidatus Fermentibacteria bacterium]|nr:nucleotidyltransferase family protein [Candidatus Fermentibacteria bacterium]